MQRLLTVRQMCNAWDLPQCMVAQVTKNMTPVDYTSFGVRRSGLYSVSEVAAELAEDTQNKLQRAEEAVTYYKDRLRRLSRFLETEGVEIWNP